MAYEREAEALAAHSKGYRERVRALARATFNLQVYRKRVDAYATCFLGEDGELSEAGAIVVADLMRAANMGAEKPGQSADAVRENVGARRVVLRLIEFLREDPAKLRRMARQIRELSDE